MRDARSVVGRLAPTPSGHLHLGNVLAFTAAWLSARSAGGRLLLRVEDVDRGRAREDVAASQRDDLRWLGLCWDEEVPAQSTRDYGPWLDRLGDRVYGCACSRAELKARGGRCGCRDAPAASGALRFRLDPRPVHFVDRKMGARIVDPTVHPDPVLRRRDGVWAYNLAVVADDVADGVTEVVRGADLLDHTAVQIQIWEALGATPPTWLHAPLVLGPDGRKLSKSHGSTELRALRAAGWDPARVWQTVLPWLGLEPVDDIALAVGAFDPAAGPTGPLTFGTDGPGDPGAG